MKAPTRAVPVTRLILFSFPRGPRPLRRRFGASSRAEDASLRRSYEPAPPLSTVQRRQPLRNGAGVAAVFGISTRAIALNGEGRQAWQTFASQATERKRN